MNDLIKLLAVLLVIGIVLWAIRFAPLDAAIQQLIRGIGILIAIVFVILFVLHIFGLAPGLKVF